MYIPSSVIANWLDKLSKAVRAPGHRCDTTETARDVMQSMTAYLNNKQPKKHNGNPLTGGEFTEAMEKLLLPEGYSLMGNYGDGLWRVIDTVNRGRILGAPLPTIADAVERAWEHYEKNVKKETQS